MLLALALVLASFSFARRVHPRNAHHHNHHIGSHSEKIHGPFTDHFARFLQNNQDRYKYAYDAYEHYGSTGTFGGKTGKDGSLNHTPILFIHGNSDSALDFGAADKSNSGWNKHVDYLASKGYSSAEFYGLTYGDRTLAHSFMRSINCDDLLGHRRFAEAIMLYTQSSKINIIAHSMGVTIARAVAQGGVFHLSGKTCDLGESLSNNIDTFISICSANYGMCICEGLTQYPACNETVGFFPGTCKADATACNSAEACDGFSLSYSSVLRQLNERNEKDAKFMASLWSTDDQVIGIGGNLVYGRQTSKVPFSDVNARFLDFSHFEMKTETIQQQYHLLKHHKLPPRMYNPLPSSNESDEGS